MFANEDIANWISNLKNNEIYVDKSQPEFDEELDAKRAAVAEHWAEERSKGLFATSRVSDDGMIDPRDTRMIISIVLSACHNEEVKGTKEYGTWRM